ncbi:uncharacterized protein LOC121731177 [Aricia agestis]|uniref:uncharacterized protein LOC121731177 n=1 Tax=Aricia agestis TaxID=91739 RepID=UPI001C20546F|nr:uncharacterized protein LOC121731177 [Aricia agestis]
MNTFYLQRRGSLSENIVKHTEPKPSRSAPVTPCDSANPWSNPEDDKAYYSDKGYSRSDKYEVQEYTRSDKASYEASVEGVWWWRRPLGVRHSACRSCGASSSTRPLQLASPPATYDYDQRPISSGDRPLNFIRQLFL